MSSARRAARRSGSFAGFGNDNAIPPAGKPGRKFPLLILALPLKDGQTALAGYYLVIASSATRARAATLFQRAMKIRLPPFPRNLKPAGRKRQFWARRFAPELLHAAQKLVRLGQAVREAAGVGAVAAPVGQFLHGHALLAAGGIFPRKPRLGIEHGDVG